MYFYPRPPRGGRHSGQYFDRGYPKISIHALREEGDKSSPKPPRSKENFYPRPPRGGRPPPPCVWPPPALFLSTPSARRATFNKAVKKPVCEISIHALREEGDKIRIIPRKNNANFYPRPPRGGRLYSASVSFPAAKFLSTPSARRATSFFSHFSMVLVISIHALREEGDKELF